MNKHLKICIDARISDGVYGGVQQVVIGLAAGLQSLAPPHETFHFLVHPDSCEWLTPYLNGPCAPLPGPVLGRQHSLHLKTYLPDWLRQRLSRMLARASRNMVVPRSDGTIERAGMDLIHFPFQGAFLTGLPSLFQPHDLQHVHYPQYFTPREVRKRDVTYREFCRQARIVVMMSRWAKSDLVHHYHIPPTKVAVVAGGAVTAAYPIPSLAEMEAFKLKHRLREPFFFYPAKTFAHKNHLGLLQALHLLKTRKGLPVSLVCAGVKSDYFRRIQEMIQQLQLADQVQFLGYVSPRDIQCLYRICLAVIFPSRFEGWGLPVTEALHTGVPLACSNLPSLTEQTGDAALLFDPDSPQQMADTMEQLLNDAPLRQSLAQRGRERGRSATWERAARTFLALYRKMAGQALNEEDLQLVQEAFTNSNV